jgi:hypothetical protein
VSWSNEKPTEPGIYWYVEKRWVDGDEIEPVGPLVVDLVFDYKGDVELMYLGDDCPGGFDQMVSERNEPIQYPFGWDDSKTREEKLKKRVVRKSEYWLMKIEEPELP